MAKMSKYEMMYEQAEYQKQKCIEEIAELRVRLRMCQAEYEKEHSLRNSAERLLEARASVAAECAAAKAEVKRLLMEHARRDMDHRF